MKVLILGNGGREHALAWKLAQSPRVELVYVAPGNAGTALEPGVLNVDIGTMDFPALTAFVRNQQIGLTVVGPEAPLVAGVVDYFRDQGLRCFGPDQAAARLEGSKAFSKDFLLRHGIPTAAYQHFTDAAAAIDYVRLKGTPIVIKADGLAAGKGVIIAQDQQQAETAIRDMLSGNRFGSAGSRVVIEEFLRGEEASFIVMVDGEHVLPMATSQDHKARDNGDQGPNTGGMGAYSPAPVVTPEIHERIMAQVIMPTVQGMRQDGNAYTGFLYAGLMISPAGDINVIEYNCRFGDPETQPIMLRLKTDLLTLCEAALEQTLDQQSIEWDNRPAVGVVMASGGYPEAYSKGHLISGLDEAAQEASQQGLTAKVFHAGTRLDNGQVYSNGGRVLCVTALGNSVTQAQAAAYRMVGCIHWDQAFCRTDIAYRAITREQRDSDPGAV
ncbi:MAG: phosphoribosylamine--glycine ligase [Pseudomonadales bacterium]|nr:phosphoribosylamine--glycine ligase [Pseudomonadales bacterium]